MCGGPRGPGVPGWTQIRGSYGWLGPGNTNVRVMRLGWVVPGIVPSRYPVSRTRLGTYQDHEPTVHRSPGPWEHAHMTVFRDPKEILGVEYAQYTAGTLRAVSDTARHLTP